MVLSQELNSGLFFFPSTDLTMFRCLYKKLIPTISALTMIFAA